MAVSSRQVQNKLDGNGALTGKSGTVYDVNIKYTAPDGASLGLSMNFEAVTARYVDVRLERKKEVLDAYHGALDNAIPAAAKESATPKKGESTGKKKSDEMEL